MCLTHWDDASPNSHFCLFKSASRSFGNTPIDNSPSNWWRDERWLSLSTCLKRWGSVLQASGAVQVPALFPWAGGGSLSLISARWLTLMDAGHESRAALISLPQLHEGTWGWVQKKTTRKWECHRAFTEGSWKNEAARTHTQNWPESSAIQFHAEDKTSLKSQSLTVGVRHTCRKATRRASIFSRAGWRAWHMFPALRSLHEGHGAPNSGTSPLLLVIILHSLALKSHRTLK